MSADSVLIGIGNPFRRDDGVGWAVADEIERRGHPTVRVEWLDGEPARLVEAWRGAARAVVVDAMSTGLDPGSVQVLDRADLVADGGGSHGMGVTEALDLAVALGRLVPHVVVVGVEGVDFAFGEGLSRPVSAAVGAAADLVERALAGDLPPSRTPVSSTVGIAPSAPHRRPRRIVTIDPGRDPGSRGSVVP